MKRYLLITSVVLVWASIANAQQQPPEYVLKVTPTELDIISEGLQTQPFGKVVPLINKLRDQVIAQQPKVIDPPKPEDKK